MSRSPLPDGRPYPVHLRISWRWKLATLEELYTCRLHRVDHHPPLHAEVYEQARGRGWGWHAWHGSPLVEVTGDAPTREKAERACESALAAMVLDRIGDTQLAQTGGRDAAGRWQAIVGGGGNDDSSCC